MIKRSGLSGLPWDSAFKVATIRNTELSGPFFHNRGQKPLEEVVEFYYRGADFTGENEDNKVKHPEDCRSSLDLPSHRAKPKRRCPS